MPVRRPALQSVQRPALHNQNSEIRNHSKYLSYAHTVLLTYGLTVFTAHWLPAALVLAASFYHPVVGAMGLVGCAVSNVIAGWLGVNKPVWKSGIYGVSGLLVGIALGMYAEPSVRMWTFLLLGSAFAGVVAVMLASWLTKYDLPILSVSFMMIVWPVLLTIGVTQGDSGTFLKWSLLAGLDHRLFDTLPLWAFSYVKTFGNILFQENLISGILVMLAIGLYSRMSLAYGLWGTLLGMLTYYFLHGSLDGYHGLNYLLTALALGGFFLVSNVNTLLLTTLAVVSVGIIDGGVTEFLTRISPSPLHPVPSLVFAFNFVTLLFLYPLKQRYFQVGAGRLYPVPLAVIRSPEANLRWAKRVASRTSITKTVLTPPFMGEWTVLQGNDGEWTHKGIGRYAWDFVVTDTAGHQHRGFGVEVEDYYAFGLPVLAPAHGTIHAVVANVADNPPGTAVTERNWGNYVIINHHNGEYSELSHFKQGGIVAVPGQVVERGQLLGYCGNSGRSPVPHIHFQLQAEPTPGAASLPAQFAEATVDGTVTLPANPPTGASVARVEIEAAAEWTLLGKETKQWKFAGRLGWRRFTETLTFATDYYGSPIITVNERFVWYLLDRPNFIAVVPDYQTFPSFLTPSAWMDAVGEELILPKRLAHNLRFRSVGTPQFGSVGAPIFGSIGVPAGETIVQFENDRWKIRTPRCEIILDAEKGEIVEVKTGKGEMTAGVR